MFLFCFFFCWNQRGALLPRLVKFALYAHASAIFRFILLCCCCCFFILLSYFITFYYYLKLVVSVVANVVVGGVQFDTVLPIPKPLSPLFTFFVFFFYLLSLLLNITTMKSCKHILVVPLVNICARTWYV